MWDTIKGVFGKAAGFAKNPLVIAGILTVVFGSVAVAANISEPFNQVAGNAVNASGFTDMLKGGWSTLTTGVTEGGPPLAKGVWGQITESGGDLWEYGKSMFADAPNP
ncbi:MAG: hypothetical protein DHS20C02_02160 [Micavibrio sp.]|nr:MAG: hypothetical protein DHS20C02_02160 [Micavibrio sp.]